MKDTMKYDVYLVLVVSLLLTNAICAMEQAEIAEFSTDVMFSFFKDNKFADNDVANVLIQSKLGRIDLLKKRVHEIQLVNTLAQIFCPDKNVVISSYDDCKVDYCIYDSFFKKLIFQMN